MKGSTDVVLTLWYTKNGLHEPKHRLHTPPDQR
jgi:hypothetical protein